MGCTVSFICCEEDFLQMPVYQHEEEKKKKGRVSCFFPNTWQDGVAFALGNVEIPQSLTLGAFVVIHNTSE
ncbi:hypothetical protein PAMP_004127 [Pampus punctatissimus]